MTVPGTALVVGSSGFVGGYVCRNLIRDGWTVVGVDPINIYKPAQWALFLRHYEQRQKQQLGGLDTAYRLDASQPLEMQEVLNRHKPTIVLNFGGTAVADVCKNNIHEAVDSIYLLNANLLQLLKSSDTLERYFYVSSSMTYGDFQTDSPREDAPKEPKDPYGAIKLGGEHLIHSFHQQFALPYTIVRPSAIYGPLDSNMRVSGIFMLNAHLGKPLTVNDPIEALDFTYIDDAANGMVLAATHANGENETFNITRGEGRTIEDFARAVASHFPGTRIETGGGEHMPGLSRPKRGGLSIEKARQLLGYAPQYDLEAGVAEYAKQWAGIFGPPGTPL